MADKDKAREERLAAALRENLRKRKAQARAILPELASGRGTAEGGGGGEQDALARPKS